MSKISWVQCSIDVRGRTVRSARSRASGCTVRSSVIQHITGTLVLDAGRSYIERSCVRLSGFKISLNISDLKGFFEHSTYYRSSALQSSTQGIPLKEITRVHSGQGADVDLRQSSSRRSRNEMDKSSRKAIHRHIKIITSQLQRSVFHTLCQRFTVNDDLDHQLSFLVFPLGHSLKCLLYCVNIERHSVGYEIHYWWY